jgi:thiosulfate reductase cytochrome b subunit
VSNPRIVGEVQPYSLNHDVARGEWATSDCQACHNATSKVTAPIQLAGYMPGSVTPEFVKDANTVESGEIYTDGSALFYQPATGGQGLYVFGHDRLEWVDWVGLLAVLGALGGAVTHGGIRFFSTLRQPKQAMATKSVYMYAVYERFWHWLQTFSILLLIFTGLVIHRPDLLGWLSFPHMVLVHNVLAAILVINAALSLFYHLVSGEIKQYIPRPYGFFDQAIVQAKFYLSGIFKGGPHPFEKTVQKKLNPLQQLTYFGILNVLLPLQILTGALMWGVQQWPYVAGWFGGLPFLAPFHSLVAWLFAAFIIGHVYLTTTAHEPLASMKAMMLGWDTVEDHSQSNEEVTAHDNTGTTETQTTDLQPQSPTAE